MENKKPYTGEPVN